MLEDKSVTFQFPTFKNPEVIFPEHGPCIFALLITIRLGCKPRLCRSGGFSASSTDLGCLAIRQLYHCSLFYYCQVAQGGQGTLQDGRRGFDLTICSCSQIGRCMNCCCMSVIVRLFPFPWSPTRSWTSHTAISPSFPQTNSPRGEYAQH